MQLPHPTTSAKTLLKRYGVYHLAKLQADKALKEMARDWKTAQDRLEAHLDEARKACAASQAELASRNASSARMDRQIRAFALGVLQKVDNKRRSDLYRIYFPKGWSPVLLLAPPAKAQRVGVILTLLAEEKDPALTAYVHQLREAQRDLGNEIRAFKEASDRKRIAADLLRVEKISWFDAYRRDGLALSLRFYQTPKRVRTYFKAIRKAKKPKRKPPEPAKVDETNVAAPTASTP